MEDIQADPIELEIESYYKAVPFTLWTGFDDIHWHNKFVYRSTATWMIRGFKGGLGWDYQGAPGTHIGYVQSIDYSKYTIT